MTRAALLVAIAALASGCKHAPATQPVRVPSPAAAPAAPAPAQPEHVPTRLEVHIIGFKFVPAQLDAQAGDTVVFINDDGFDHTTTSDSVAGGWNSPELRRGSRFTLVVREGDHPYHCAAHPSMRATLAVRR